jgi:shikimate dehydrogenase
MEVVAERTHNLYGLVGKNISYSFSKRYFNEKFKSLGLDSYQYVNFDIPNLIDFPGLLKEHPNLRGLNITIPYKEAIISYLDELSEEARQIKAVNTIAFTKKGTKGFNTDCYGFKKSITPLLQPHHNQALVLGAGGASRAIVYVLEELKISYQIVSRSIPGTLRFEEIRPEMMPEYPIIINTTPLGTTPNIHEKPPLPYSHLTPAHLLYDLVYNPPETTFLKEGKKMGATLCNGLEMLHFQAEKAWEIWNSESI